MILFFNVAFLYKSFFTLQSVWESRDKNGAASSERAERASTNPFFKAVS